MWCPAETSPENRLVSGRPQHTLLPCSVCHWQRRATRPRPTSGMIGAQKPQATLIRVAFRWVRFPLACKNRVAQKGNPVLVPLTGIEPVRILLRGILSPLCLPIPPQRHIKLCLLFFSGQLFRCPVAVPGSFVAFEKPSSPADRCHSRPSLAPPLAALGLLPGIEPVRILLRGILSPLCLPIPPQRHGDMGNSNIFSLRSQAA